MGVKRTVIIVVAVIILGILSAKVVFIAKGTRVRPVELRAPKASPSSIPVLGCMIVNRPDLLLEMVHAIDFPVDKLVLVHNADSHQRTNSETDALMEQLLHGSIDLGHNHIRSVVDHHHDNNLGFSAGVNQIVLAAPDAAYWLVVSNDVKFRPGSLAEIATKMADTADPHSSSCVWGLVGDPVSQYASFVITPKAIQAVGYFDENFWPAYGEDCDYTVRLAHAECPLLMEQDANRLGLHVGSASWKTTGGTSKMARIVQRGGPTFNNFDYLGAKWGADICGSRILSPPYIKPVGYPTPFNKQGSALSAFTLDQTRRKQIGGPTECFVCDSSMVPTVIVHPHQAGDNTAQEAQQEYSQLLQQGSNHNACLSLATQWQHEVRAAVNVSQHILDQSVLTQDCHGGSELQTATAAYAESVANRSRTEAALETALSARVTWTVPYLDIEPENLNATGALFLASPAFIAAQAAVQAAQVAAVAANSSFAHTEVQLSEARSNATNTSGDANLCYCVAKASYHRTFLALNQSLHADNEAAWTQAFQLECEIQGTPLSKCHVPELPRLRSRPVSTAAEATDCTAFGNLETEETIAPLPSDGQERHMPQHGNIVRHPAAAPELVGLKINITCLYGGATQVQFV